MAGALAQPGTASAIRPTPAFKGANALEARMVAPLLHRSRAARKMSVACSFVSNG